MKIRTGFVSNSSGSSFVLVYLPDDFDYDSNMEYMIEKMEKQLVGLSDYMLKWRREEIESIKRVTESDIKTFIKKGFVYQSEEGDDGDGFNDKFSQLWKFLEDYVILTSETYENSGVLQILDKKLLDKLNVMKAKNHENILKYADLAEERRHKRALKKQKMQHVDPYEEEDWDDEI
jgi:hypothetical protein